MENMYSYKQLMFVNIFIINAVQTVHYANAAGKQDCHYHHFTLTRTNV